MPNQIKSKTGFVVYENFGLWTAARHVAMRSLCNPDDPRSKNGGIHSRTAGCVCVCDVELEKKHPKFILRAVL